MFDYVYICSIMVTFPTETELNGATGLVVAVTALAGLVIRAIEKAIIRRRNKKRGDGYIDDHLLH